jgi:hypothetical protein
LPIVADRRCEGDATLFSGGASLERETRDR